MGLGLLGRGVGDSQFLGLHAKEVLVTDKKSEEVLQESVKQLQNMPSITFRLGEHVLEDFENRDFILKAAGVPLNSEYILHAREHKVPVYMSAALVSYIVKKEVEGATIIGVTGTRGKSTTTSLIAHILKENSLRVHVGGNIRGVANLPLLDEVEEGDFLVLELDSWQLQGFRDLSISPHIAVFTNFLEDHMNYYHNDREAYFNDKAAIYRAQDKYDVLIASDQAKAEIEKRDKHQEMVVAGGVDIKSNLLGNHNKTLVSIAYEVALQCGIPDEDIRRAVETFKAVQGRLEDLGLFKGVRVINDNNATTEDASVAGIEAVFEHFGAPPIVIVGGADKGLPTENLERALQEKAKAVIYLSGTGTDRISLPKTYLYDDLKECLGQAFALAKEGDTVIFTPAFASFSKYFNNEYERNDYFLKELQKYA